MARIAGVNLPTQKRVEIGLTYIYGIGQVRSRLVLSEANIDMNSRIKDLSRDEVSKIQVIIDKKYRVEGDLRREVLANIKRLKEIGSYRGDRHVKKLPSRGQRSKTNARTKRGKKLTMGSGRKKSAAKT